MPTDTAPNGDQDRITDSAATDADYDEDNCSDCDQEWEPESA